MDVKILFLVLLSLVGCTSLLDALQQRDLQYETEDGFIIYGKLYFAAENKGTVFLIHMLNSNQESYSQYIPELVGAGYNVITYDLRGHGMSTYKKGNEVPWQTFIEEDFKKMEDDQTLIFGEVQKSYPHLNSENSIYFGGSIGSTVAYNTGIRNDHVTKLVILSPGENYRGFPLTSDQTLEKPVFVAVGTKDQYSFETTHNFFSQKEFVTVVEYESDSHGTTLLSFDPELLQTIIVWLDT